MPTHEERLTTLEQTTSEYKPVLQNFAYELSMVKGLIITQTDITQELKVDMKDVKIQLAHVERRLDTIDQRIGTLENRLGTLEKDMGEVKSLLGQIIERLPNPL